MNRAAGSARGGGQRELGAGARWASACGQQVAPPPGRKEGWGQEPCGPGDTSRDMGLRGTPREKCPLPRASHCC